MRNPLKHLGQSFFTAAAAAALSLTAPAPAEAYPAGPDFRADQSDAEAIAWADRAMQAMGGWDAWANTRFLTWTFFSGRHHVWDKWTGRYRLEDPANELVVLMNLQDRSGRAWKAGAEVSDPAERQTVLEKAYAAWVNDAYWLLMPYKLKDSGVALRFLGRSPTEDGRDAVQLELTFENVGLTPQNKYHVWIDAETHLVSQWAFFRQAGDEVPSFTLPWKNWRRYGEILISNERGVRDGRERRIENVAVFSSLPDALFRDPSAPLPQKPAAAQVGR